MKYKYKKMLRNSNTVYEELMQLQHFKLSLYEPWFKLKDNDKNIIEQLKNLGFKKRVDVSSKVMYYCDLTIDLETLEVRLFGIKDSFDCFNETLKMFYNLSKLNLIEPNNSIDELETIIEHAFNDE